MTRIALLTSEPIRRHMAGIGIRYLELARRLPAYQLDVVLVTTGEVDEVPLPEGGLDGVTIRRFARGRLAELLADCDGAVAQGQIANDLLIEVPALPAVIDLYDPFLVENLCYLDTLGLDPFRNDHATWVLQLSRGDFFLCSCEEQRLFYLGFLTALGRVNPHLVARDGDLASLIAVVPFGVPDPLPEPRTLLPERQGDEKRLLFGGLYDWYDPWPVLEALEKLDRPSWKLLVVRNPNPGGTPQKLYEEVRRWCVRRGWWEERVLTLDWVAAERRYDLLREVDLLLATHDLSLETRLSLRTRFLDALAVGCPVLTSEGGAMSRLLREHDAGWVVPVKDAAAVAGALVEMLEGAEDRVAARRQAGRELLWDFSWEKALAPLVDFCRHPRKEETGRDFLHQPGVKAPDDRLAFRIKRWWQRRLGRR